MPRRRNDAALNKTLRPQLSIVLLQEIIPRIMGRKIHNKGFKGSGGPFSFFIKDEKLAPSFVHGLLGSLVPSFVSLGHLKLHGASHPFGDLTKGRRRPMNPRIASRPRRGHFSFFVRTLAFLLSYLNAFLFFQRDRNDEQHFAEKKTNKY